MLLRFDEANVEQHFGLSVSKLRSAQRIRFIQAIGTLNDDRRYVRTWGITEIAKAWMANELAYHLQIPFLVACEIIQSYEGLRQVDAGDSIVFDDYLQDHPHPRLFLYERKYVFFTDEAEQDVVSLGLLDVGADGRMMFLPTRGSTPDEVHSASRTEVRPLVLRQRFKAIIDTVAPDT